MKKFSWIVFMIACLDVALIAVVISLGATAQVFFVQRAVAHTNTTAYGWYYRPRTDGLQPEKNTELEFIYDYDAYSVGDPGDKVIYLTFDAGFENGHTPEILDALKKHDAPAAFFVVGHYIESNPELVCRMVDEGHLVCNHSTHHKNMANMVDFEAFKAEMTGIEDIYMQTTGETMPKYFRPPEGTFSELSLEYACELGYSTIFWSFAYKDWLEDAQPSEGDAIEIIISRTHPGEIVLLHSTSATNAKVLDQVITEWENMGYRLESLDHLILGLE